MLAIIPARGGSKRIPRKNIRSFAGRPMIRYAIDAALGSGLFEHVVVSTDDAEIAEVARASGAEVPFIRPAALADDFTPTVPVIAQSLHACAALGWTPDIACCIYPTVPFLEPGDLRDGLALLQASASDYVFPVAQYPSAIQRALRRAEDGTVRPLYPEHADTRTQELEPAYHDAGQFYWGKGSAWLAGTNVHLNASTIVLPTWRVVDIDTPADWSRAEGLFAAIKKQPPGSGEPAPPHPERI